MSPVRSRSPAPGKYSIYRPEHLHPECGIVPAGLFLQPHAQDMTLPAHQIQGSSFGRQNGGPSIYEKIAGKRRIQAACLRDPTAQPEAAPLQNRAESVDTEVYFYIYFHRNRMPLEHGRLELVLPHGLDCLL